MTLKTQKNTMNTDIEALRQYKQIKQSINNL